MNVPAVALAALIFWAGAAVALSPLPWFSRRPLTERLAPYTPGQAGARRTSSRSARSLHDLLTTVGTVVGGRASRLLGVHDDLATRLERADLAVEPAEFRVRQLGWCAAGLLVGVAGAIAISPPPILSALFVLGGPALAFLLVEEQLSSAVAERQRRLRLELPVVAEQFGMLLGAGYSLAGAIHRLADRGAGASGDDLARVVARMRQGATEAEALTEWAARSGLDELRRLVAVLALNREAGDLGRLVAEEARSIRRDVQRHRIEIIERRSQQVWIPVTVAALLPGALLISIPFLQALRAFGAT